MSGSRNNNLFHEVGPFQLTNVNWNEAKHCRMVAASLVKGVYLLENDRANNRQDVDALAPAWWNFFNFKMIDQLVDSSSRTIYCAVFRYNNSTDHSAPHYVISFRGTVSFQKTKDWKVNSYVIQQQLKKTTRFRETMSFTEKYITETHNIWLTGHSLGASMALNLGREWAMKKVFLSTHLFNSPFTSISYKWIKNLTVRRTVNVFDNVIKVVGAGLNRVIRPDESSEDSFKKLVDWKPMVYVHPEDPVCFGYIDYFQRRDEMKRINCLGWMENIATRHSKISLLKNLIGKGAEAGHLIPSATLVVNKTPADSSFPIYKRYAAHKLKHWWRDDLEVEISDFKYEE